MKKQRILVVSSANIDFVQRMRRVPYSGESVVEQEMGYSYVPGGKGANAALTFAKFGADCVFVCKLGNDANAKRLLSMYQKDGIDTRYVSTSSDLPTGLSSVLVEENGKNRSITYPGANNSITPDDVESSFTCYPDALYMHLDIPEEAIFDAAERAHESGIPVFIDASPARLDFPLRKLGKVEIFATSDAEARVFTGINPTTEESCLRAAIKLASFVDTKFVVIKLGANGAFIFDGSEYYVVESTETEIVDLNASADVFSAVMAFVYLSNGNIVSAAKYASCAASISASRSGAYTSIPSKNEVIAYAKALIAAREAEAEQEVEIDYDAYRGYPEDEE